MSFLAPIFLAGMAAIAAPIILHMIQRQRYPDRPFTTLRFFDKTIKHNVIRRRLVDRILLILRIAVLLLLALALARPMMPGGLGEKRMSLVIVLDNSPSMGRLNQRQALFQRACEGAAKLLAQLGPNDRAAVILMEEPAFSPAWTTDRKELLADLQRRRGQPSGLLVRKADGVALVLPGLTTDPEVVSEALKKVEPSLPVALIGVGIEGEPRLTSDHAGNQALLDRAELSGQPGDVSQALAKAAALMKMSDDGDRTIMIFSDLQKSDWQGAGDVDCDDVPIRVVEVAPMKSSAPNLALDGCVAPVREAGFGRELMCTAMISNHGNRPSGPARLVISVGEEKRSTNIQVPAIPPAGSLQIPFPVRASSRGDTLLVDIVLEAPGDPFAYDNAWHLQVPISPPLRVLCVNGISSTDPGENSAYFVRNALVPRAAAAGAEVFADLQECAPAELAKKELFQYNVIVLADVETLDQRTRSRLREFAEDGGGILVFPGQLTKAEEYNAWGFLPARIVERKTKNFVYVTALSRSDPRIAELAERVGDGLHGLSATTWLKLEPNDGAEPLGKLSNDAPAIVGGRIGKGRIVLAAAGCHTSNSDWPLRSAFVLLTRGLARYVAAGDQHNRLAGHLLVGEGVAKHVPPALRNGVASAFRVSLKAGAFKYAPTPWHRVNDRLLLPVTKVPGHYLLAIQPTGPEGVLPRPGLGAAITPVAVNHAASEGIFAAIAATELKQLKTSADVEVIALTPDHELRVDEFRTGSEIWRVLMIAAVLVVFVESLLAWLSVTDASKEATP